MGRRESMIKKIYKSEGGRWALAGLYCLALLGLVLLFQTPTFYDVDDQNIAWALAGYRSGAPSFSHPFINCVTAWLVSGLYTIFPGISWWYFAQALTMFLGMSAVCASLLKICARRGLPFYAPLFGVVLLSGGLFYYPLVLTTFTLSSTVAGCGAVALILAADPEDAPGTQGGYLAGGIALLVLCLLIRQSSGLALACFFAAALFYRLMKDPGTARKRTLITAGAALAAVALLTASNAYGRRAENPGKFLTFDEARASYMDYPHDTYQENPALYDSLDWDGTMYELVNAWCYMDERVNARTFTAAAEGSAFAGLSLPERIGAGLSGAGTFLQKYPLARYWFIMAACAFLLLLLSWGLGNRPPAELWSGIAAFGGMGALFGYLCYAGRINLRTQMTVVFPAVVMLWLLTALCFVKRETGEKPGRILARCLSGLLTLLSLFCGYKVFRTVTSYESEEMLSSGAELIEYVRSRPENVYIREVYAAVNVDAFAAYTDRLPTNLMDWGGCDMYTASREAQNRLNGLDSPYGDVFLKNHVYFVTTENSPYLELMENLMANRYGAKGYEICDTLENGCIVVKFLP